MKKILIAFALGLLVFTLIGAPALASAPVITTSSLPVGEVGAFYSLNLVASGGTSPYHWSGPPLPAGLLLADSGLISGTPTTAAIGATTFTFVVTDSGSVTDTKGLLLTIVAPPSITTNAALPNGTVGVTYSQPLGVTDGTLPYAWSLQSGTLPSGLNLTLAGGIWGIRGSPDTAGGPFSFTVRVTDGLNVSAAKAMAITIDAAAPTVTTGAVTDITTITATGNGTVTADGGSAITGRGIAWNTAGSPTITSDSYASDLSATTGSYSVSMTGLTAGTPYHVRAYATNASGTSYGIEVTFTTAIDTANGAGIASFSTSAGTIENLTAVAENTLPTLGKPNNVTFPFGLFSFNITGLAYPPGQTVYVTITLPPLPVVTDYYKYHANEGGWIPIPMVNPGNNNVITITLVDGGLGDDDITVNGIIKDPGGPTIPSPNMLLTKTAALAKDADGDGVPSPGDTLKYTAVIKNTGTQAATGVDFSDTPDPNTTLLNGTVTTTKGGILKGNNNGDKTVDVSIGTMPIGGTATVTFEVVIRHLGFPWIINQAITTGTNFASVMSDDPNTAQPNDPTTIQVKVSPGVPSISFWGIMAMVLLLAGAMVWAIRRKQIRGEKH